MLIAPTSGGAQVSSTAHGLLAAIVSLVLGIAAHSLGGGHIPSSTQLVVLVGLALCVGLVRAGQVRSVERARVAGRIKVSVVGVLAALTAGQAAAHVVLSVIDGHHGTAMVPGSLMLTWHLLAVPAAAGVLFVAERLSRACGDNIAHLWRLLSLGVSSQVEAVTSQVDRQVATLTPAPMRAAAGVRGPPVRV
ncbi:hypothetical protein [Gordonia sp. (in: high G+C Gram-positive bacteria)]|uniref:hypothetical protein n=1 Tax=Gordonia sp. (in: high G+C Gram-positive bacteria) TaxID=84139 RepID=UPI003C77D836